MTNGRLDETEQSHDEMSSESDEMSSESKARRAFLGKVGRFAVVTPPAIALLLGTSLGSKAIAGSAGWPSKGSHKPWKPSHQPWKPWKPSKPWHWRRH